MTEKASGIRLFVDHDLAADASVTLSKEHSHYLVNVMRRQAGTLLHLFNGRDGEWLAEVVEASKRVCVVELRTQSAPQSTPPDVWMLFAPIKKARTDFIVEKAVELGVRAIRPVFTEFTNSERVRPEKLFANMVEAAEQCGGVFVPTLDEARPLAQVLQDWPEGRKILFCDERREALPIAQALRAAGHGPWAILIGPEGGFSEAEVTKLRTHPAVVSATLGPRILRADTAAVAALGVWQSVLGDWEDQT